MKKNYVLFLMCTSVLCLTSSTISTKSKTGTTEMNLDGLLQPDHSIRYLNSMEVMQESERGKVVAKELDAKREGWQKELKKMSEDYQEAMKEYETKRLTMSVSAREQAEKKINRLKRELEARSQEIEQDFQLAMRKATDQLLQEVEQIVATLAKEHKWDAVLDTMTGRVLYTTPDVEVSNTVVSAWNDKHKKDTQTV